MTAQAPDVHRLIAVAGRTYASEAGIRLADRPAPLYQLLVLASLMSKPIAAQIAVDAGRELFRAGGRTPRGTLRLTWQQRVDALGRAHYRRYDESTATRLGEAAQLVLDRWRGDVRRLAGPPTNRIAADLQNVPGIGPVGADIFLREVQAVWPDVRPYLGERAADAARARRLPHTARGLAGRLGTSDLSELTAALIRVSLDRDLLHRLDDGS